MDMNLVCRSAGGPEIKVTEEKDAWESYNDIMTICVFATYCIRVIRA